VAKQPDTRPGRFNLRRFLQGEGPEPGPILLTQNRVYILPTRHGVFFGLQLLVMLVAAVNYNNSLAYALTFLLSSLCLVAILHTYRNLLHVQVDVAHIPPVFCGDNLSAPVRLDNTRKGTRYAVGLQFPPQDPSRVDLPGDQCFHAGMSLPTQQRGRHRLGRLTLHTTYPLGLFRAWGHAQFDRHYLVYPRPDDYHPLPVTPSYHLNLSGDRGVGSDDFATLRHYHPGDPLRHVHWKIVARGQGLHIKQFGGDRAEELWLNWDDLPTLDTEARLSRLTRWVMDADTAQFSYGLKLPGSQIPLGHGPAHRHRCLKALALFGANTPDTGTAQTVAA